MMRTQNSVHGNLICVRSLTEKWCKFGYYWRRGVCVKNTAMPVVCSTCGAKGRPGKGKQIRKELATYIRDYHTCGPSERIQTEA